MRFIDNKSRPMSVMQPVLWQAHYTIISHNISLNIADTVSIIAAMMPLIMILKKKKKKNNNDDDDFPNNFQVCEGHTSTEAVYRIQTCACLATEPP